MRVSFGLSYEKRTDTINARQEEVTRLSGMVSSGKRMLQPGDNPLSWAQAMDMKQALRELEAIGKNMDFALNWEKTTESSLSQLATLVVSAKDVAMQAQSINYPLNKTELDHMLDELIKEARSHSETQYEDMYIFSGRSTSVAPFNPDDNSYQGDTEVMEVRLGKEERQAVNLNGQEAFFTDPDDPETNLFNSLAALRNAIEEEDKEAIASSLEALEKSREHLVTKRAQVGARIASLDRRQEALGSLKVSEEGRLTAADDADMVTVISTLQQKKTAFEAALQTAASLDGLNLLRYL